MTIEEIANTLPNGFHDAQIKGIGINYIEREVTMDLELWVSDSVKDNSEDYREADMKLLGLLFLVMEPPDPRYDFQEKKPLWVDAMPLEASKSTATQLPVVLPEKAFTYSFFVHDWNAFIHVAAMDASLSWK